MASNTKYKHSDEFRKQFGDRLRNTRKEKGLSIEQARIALEIPRTTYASWELGSRIPLSKSLSELATLYNTNVDYLMLKTDDPNPQIYNDLETILDSVEEVTWKGKTLTPDQTSMISALIDTYLNTNKNG